MWRSITWNVCFTLKIYMQMKNTIWYNSSQYKTKHFPSALSFSKITCQYTFNALVQSHKSWQLKVWNLKPLAMYSFQFFSMPHKCFPSMLSICKHGKKLNFVLGILPSKWSWSIKPSFRSHDYYWKQFLARKL